MLCYPYNKGVDCMAYILLVIGIIAVIVLMLDSWNDFGAWM